MTESQPLLTPEPLRPRSPPRVSPSLQRTPSFIRDDAPVWQYVLAFFFSGLVALLSGSPNAFQSVFATEMQVYFDISDEILSLLTSAGLVGLFLTFPAGMLLDQLGPVVTGTIGALFVAASYFVMSFAGPNDLWLLFVGMLVLGFGGGATFTAALSAGLRATEDHTGKAVAMIGACMSLSLGATVVLIQLYSTIAPCSGAFNDCWVQQFRFMACIIASSMLLSWAYFGWTHGLQIPESSGNVSDDASDHVADLSLDSKDARLATPSSAVLNVSTSLQILSHEFFWVLVLAFFSSIGSGLLILGDVPAVWSSFVAETDRSELIGFLFSLTTSLAGLLTGWLTDRFRWISRAAFAALSLVPSIVVLISLGILTQVMDADNRDGSPAAIAFLVLIVLVGYSFGAAFTLFPTIIGEMYGFANFGKNFGFLQVSSTVASLGVPLFSTWLFKQTGDYSAAFFLFGGLLILSLLLLLKKPTSHILADLTGYTSLTTPRIGYDDRA